MSGISEQPRERRRQPRTPVDINALLIGEKTVPRGCRVVNVSQYGMLLYCEADGRLSTFNDGDNVDIHLTVQHAGKQKKLTIPSYVRHVADNSVDVEFHQPDPILMDLIESYRVSGEHRLEASLGQNHSHPENLLRPAAGGKPPLPQPAPEPPLPVAAPAPQKSLFRGLLFLLFTLCVAGGGYVYTASIDGRISTLEATSGKLSTNMEELKKRMVSASLQEGRYASLNARMTALGDAFAHLEDKVALLVPATGSISRAAPTVADSGSPASQQATTAGVPPAVSGRRQSPAKPMAATGQAPADQAAAPAESAASRTNEPAVTAQTLAAQAGKAAARAATTRSPVAQSKPAGPEAGAVEITTASDSSATGTMAPVADSQGSSGQQTAATPVQKVSSGARQSQAPVSGPWTINLASSPRKTDITRLAALAATADIPTRIEEAEVKGRHYWRLQTGGYPSYAAARTGAEPIKAALELDSVWILKRETGR